MYAVECYRPPAAPSHLEASRCQRRALRKTKRSARRAFNHSFMLSALASPVCLKQRYPTTTFQSSSTAFCPPSDSRSLEKATFAAATVAKPTNSYIIELLHALYTHLAPTCCLELAGRYLNHLKDMAVQSAKTTPVGTSGPAAVWRTIR